MGFNLARYLFYHAVGYGGLEHNKRNALQQFLPPRCALHPELAEVSGWLGRRNQCAAVRGLE